MWQEKGKLFKLERIKEYLVTNDIQVGGNFIKDDNDER